MKNPLLDQEFLRKLDLTKNKTTYAKIILLTREENPVYEVQGKITSGSVSIDGNSAVRRTCSLSMVSPDVDITNTYWALKNKFKLEVGVENAIDTQYPDIIWFKQGTFVFTSLNMNVQSNNFTITINGKDKMCLLNGEVGGSLNASTDFGQLEEYENIYSEVEVDADDYVPNVYYYLNSYGEYILDSAEKATANRKYYSMEVIRTLTSLPIVDIIKNVVQYYAGEPLSNIVINDVDDYGLELLEYRGDSETPMYLLRDKATGEVSNMTFSKEYKGCEPDNKDIEKTYIFGEGFEFYNQSGTITNLNQNPSSVYANVNGEKREYNVIKIEFGMTAGYRRTALTYPGNLVGAVGASITSAVLDKIKNMFSDFEYFYDIDGKFVFQKKKTYLNTSFSNLVAGESEIYAEDAKYTSAVTYSFENGLLLSAFTDAPQILNIKNDFSIWGVRDSVASANVPVHMRYAIDTKPVFYRPIRFEFQEIALDEDTYEVNKFYIENADGKYVLSSAPYKADMKYYEESEQQDLSVDAFEVPAYDWRELIYQMALDYFKYEHKKHNFTQLVAAANPEYYPTGMTGYENYYTDLQGFWRQLYNPEAINAEVYDYFLDSTVDKNTDFNSGDYFIKKNNEYIQVKEYDEDGITNPNIYIYDEDLSTYSKIPNPDSIDFTTNSEIFNRYYYKPDDEKEEYVEIKYYKDIAANKLDKVYLYKNGQYIEQPITELTKENFNRYYLKAAEGGYIKVDKFEDLEIPRWYYTYKEEFKKETKSLNEANFNDKDYYIKEESEYVPAEYYVRYNEIPLTYYTATTKNKETIYTKVDKQLSADDFDSEKDKKYYIQTSEGHYVRATSYNPKQVPIDYYYREGTWKQVALKESNKDYVYIQTTKDYYEEAPKFMPILHYEFINNQYIPVASITKEKTNYVKIQNRFYPISWIYQSSKIDNETKERKDWKALTTDGLVIKTDEKYAYAIKLDKDKYFELDKEGFEVPKYYQIEYEQINIQLDKITGLENYYIDLNEKKYKLQLYYKKNSKYILETEPVLKNTFGSEGSKTYYIKTGGSYKKLEEFPTVYYIQTYKEYEDEVEKFETGKKYFIKTFNRSTNEYSYYKKPNDEDHKEKAKMPQTYYYYDEDLDKFIKEEQEIDVENPSKEYYILNYIKATKFESTFETIETYYIKNSEKYEKATNISINDFYDRVNFNRFEEDGERKIKLDYYIYQDSGYTKIEKFDDMKNDKDFKKKKYYIGFDLEGKDTIYKRLSSVPRSEYELPTKDLPTFYLFDGGTYIERKHGERYKVKDEEDEKKEKTITYNILEETEDLYVKTENSGYYIKSEDSYYPINDYMVKEIPQTYYYLTHEGQYIKENIELTEELFNEKTYYKKAEIYTEITNSAMTQIPETYYQKKKLGYIELDIDGVTKGNFSIKNGFSEAVNNSPETLNFWFDFLDTHGELSKYSISAIGCRSKAVNNNKIKAIYFQETPTVLFLTEEDYEELVNNKQDYMDMTGYTFIQLTSVMENYFSISAQGLSAKDELDNLLYQHTYATETVNLTSVPIYHLQPNTRIFVKDDNTGINGEFIVSKITVPLQYNGTTAITTTRAVERIY